MKKICVMLSTYNGQKYLKEQLDSLLNQKNIDVTIMVRDDGSTDGTQDILNEYKEKGVQWYQGENVRPAKSFLDLINSAPETEYYAFCDQDDYWQENKLYAAVELMEKSNQDNTKPVFYYSNVNVVDAQLNLINKSNIDKKGVDNIKRVMMSNSAIGCTVVMNKALIEQLKKAKPSYVYMHDWWAYAVCLALGGKIVFDENAYISYRQHGNNCLGFDKKKIDVKKAMFGKADCLASRLAGQLLQCYEADMDDSVKEDVKALAYYKEKWSYKRKLLFDNSYYKTTGMQLLREKISVLRNRK